ncbi:ABC transporter substrate-binding protein [Saccharomonospora sp. NPDC006951]
MNGVNHSRSRIAEVRSARWRAGRLVALLIAVIVIMVTAGACYGQRAGGAGASGEPADQLNIGSGFVPNSLDPAKINAAMAWYVNLAYDPLIYWAPDGKLQPRLATSWKYLGEGNRVFELKLRENVTFSDGSPFTADVVKKNIEYFRDAGGESAASLTSVEAVDAVDRSTVRITLSSPDPSLPMVFTQNRLAGNMISGKAIDNPGLLATATAGAGPYVLSEDETVASDHYTYKPNPSYWNKQDVHYGKVVIKVLPNPNTALSALKTGQVDVIQGQYTTAGAAESAGLNVAHAPQVFTGLALADRAGELVPPLADVRVRRALNFAVDRKKITGGLFGEYGTPTEQIVLSGQDGYNDKSFYSYDPEQARRLLAEAGYADGFSLKVVSSANTSAIAQAIADDLGKVGVRLELTNHNDPTNYLRDVAGGEFAAYAIGFGTMPVHLMGPRLFLPSAAQFNPMRSSDPSIESWYRDAAAADAKGRAELDRRIVARLAEEAWFVPVSFIPVFMYSSTSVTGVELTPQRPASNPVEWRPS